ncbi:MAG: response regulator [Firmicutes bacterium]|nr:response regulator [Bacillota bacterium]
MEDQRKTIMIVDDNTAILALSKDMLKNYYKVYPIPSGEILLDLLENITPDLILLDVEMPHMDGYEVIKTLKATSKWAQIPVIFLTALSDEASELKGLSLGAIDYVMKPFSEPLLRRRIDNQLMAESQRKSLQMFNNNLSEMVRQKTEEMMVLQNALLSTVTDMVEFRDEVTGGHVLRTQIYIELLLKKMEEEGVYSEEISAWDKPTCASSAKLHDVGKIAVSDAILNKPGKLTNEEFSIMKSHVNVGLQVIKKLEATMVGDTFLKHARPIVGAHHERWDGMGYPFGLKGIDIPLEGRLMAIADVYDALISKRPYKLPYSTDEARGIMEESSGSQFDPALIRIFSDISGQFAEIVRQYAY